MAVVGSRDQDAEAAHVARVEHAHDAGSGPSVFGEGQVRRGLQRLQLRLEARCDKELLLCGEGLGREATARGQLRDRSEVDVGREVCQARVGELVLHDSMAAVAEQRPGEEARAV